MSEVIELIYRRFPRQLIEKLISVGYLKRSDQHNASAVKRAFERVVTDCDIRHFSQ